MSEKYLIGLDNGGTTIKATLYDLQGKEIYIATHKIGMFSNKPGHTSRDSDQLWQANLIVLKDVVDHSGVSSQDIAGIGVTGHGNGLYLTKVNGEPAYNGIISTDSRGTRYAEAWLEEGLHDKIIDKTHQSIWHGQPTAILRWFVENKPEVLEETDYILMCKDYIRFRLTGEVYAELTDMTATGLMNVNKNEYDHDLLKEYGLQHLIDKLPPVKDAIDICGYITEEVAAATGIQAGTPVSGGMHDIHAMAVATGGISDNILTVIAGTWSINQYVQEESIIDKNLFMSTSFPNNKHLITEASPTSASNLEWFLNEILKDIQLPEGKSIYDLANEAVANTTPSSSNIIFLPFLYGSESKASFLGMKAWNSRDQLIRAIYEGIVFRHRQHVDSLFKYSNHRFEKVRIAGGVVNSPVWLQMFADVLNLPVEVIIIKELGCLGAALTAGVATNLYDSLEDAVNQTVNNEKIDTYFPDRSNQETYQDKYEEYVKYDTLLRPTWENIH